MNSIRHCTYEDARCAVQRLIYSVQIMLDTTKFSGFYQPYDMRELYDLFYEAETLDDIANAIHKEIEKFQSDIPEKYNEAYQKYQQLVENVKTYIQSNYSNYNLSLDSILAEFHISSITLGRVFKMLMGIPVFHYIIQTRLEKAEYLLLHTKMTTKEIAESCGYENAPYLYTVFKKHFGLTPGEYRKKHGHL